MAKSKTPNERIKRAYIDFLMGRREASLEAVAAAFCARNPAAPRTSPSWRLSKGQYQTVVPPRDGLAPQFGQHREPVHIAPRPSSLFGAAINQAVARVRAAPSGWSG